MIPLPPAWVAAAVCAQVDPALWFPEKGGNNGPAKAICYSCPVRVDCLEYALRQEIAVDGIWGGTSVVDRRRIRRERGIDDVKPCGTRAAYTRHRQRGETPCPDCTAANSAYHRAYDQRRGAA
jgi:hypothetical protein